MLLPRLRVPSTIPTSDKSLGKALEDGIQSLSKPNQLGTQQLLKFERDVTQCTARIDNHTLCYAVLCCAGCVGLLLSGTVVNNVIYSQLGNRSLPCSSIVADFR